MPFAPKIRKDALHALDQRIIPALKTQEILQMLAEPPFDFRKTQYHILQKKFLEDREYAPLQTQQYWEKELVMSVNMPIIMFAYEGVCYERIGITRQQVRNLSSAQRKLRGGINILRLLAPAVLCHPPFMLRSLGVPRPESSAEAGRSLICRLIKDRVTLALNVRGPQEESATHNLEINDPLLVQMGQLYIEELRVKENQEGAQVQLLVFMLRLKRYLLGHHASISNSSWVVPPENISTASKVLSTQNLELCRDVTEYIITHLHAPLTLKCLAHQFDISAAHLNLLFKQAYGTTVMRHVSSLRIEAAKKILLNSPERISDIASLVGFSSAASFGLVFQKHMGFSPRNFRQRYSSIVNSNKK
jgi:AraC-like DNA-binding protein